jgi:flagellar biosynthesis protein FlhB
MGKTVIVLLVRCVIIHLYVLMAANSLKHVLTHCLEHSRQEPVSDYWKLIGKWSIYIFTLHLSARWHLTLLGMAQNSGNRTHYLELNLESSTQLCQLICKTMPELYEFFIEQPVMKGVCNVF